MNICQNCCDPAKFEMPLADVGVCGLCGVTTDCCDLDLIGLYRNLGISDDQIWLQLPRLRNSAAIPGDELLSLTELGAKLGAILGQRQ